MFAFLYEGLVCMNVLVSSSRPSIMVQPSTQNEEIGARLVDSSSLHELTSATGAPKYKIPGWMVWHEESGIIVYSMLVDDFFAFSSRLIEYPPGIDANVSLRNELSKPLSRLKVVFTTDGEQVA
jgi:hypothetical protein